MSRVQLALNVSDLESAIDFYSKLFAAELALGFKALADPVRLRLLSLIAAAPDGTACSCDLEEPVGKTQSTVSHHLSLLADAGLITKEKVGRWVNCTIVPERLAQLREVLAA